MRLALSLVATVILISSCGQSANAQCAAVHERGTAEYRACLNEASQEIKSRFPPSSQGGHR